MPDTRYSGLTDGDPALGPDTFGVSRTAGAAARRVTVDSVRGSIRTSTVAGLPAASGTWGPARLVTDGVRGLWLDVPTAGWVATNRPCNVQFWGAKSDGATNDNTAIRAAVAACGSVFLPKNTIWIPGDSTPIPAGRYIGEDFSVKVQHTGATNFTLGDGAVLENVTVQRTTGTPTQKTRSASNFTGVNQSFGANNGFHGTNVYQQGIAGLDTNTFAVINYDTGAAYYAQLENSGSGAGGFDVFMRGTSATHIPIRVAHITNAWAGNMVELLAKYDGTGTFTGNFIVAQHTGVPKFVVSGTGQVSIGTTAAAERHLVITGTGVQASLQVVSSGGRAYALISETNGSLNLQADSGTGGGFRITSTGVIQIRQGVSCRELDFADGLWKSPCS